MDPTKLYSNPPVGKISMAGQGAVYSQKGWILAGGATTIPAPKPRKRPDPVTCMECGGVFTPSGLEMHKGSRKCELRQIARPMQTEIDLEVRRLELESKHRVLKNVATAIQRRGLEELTGLELASTKLYQTDLECMILDEYWVNTWVFQLWYRENKKGYTRRAYATLEKLAAMPEAERESELGLILLRLLDE